MGTLTDSSIARLFQESFQVLDGLQAERLLILYDRTGSGELQVQASRGMRGLWSASVSLSLVHQVIESGLPLLSGDLREDPEFAESSSVLLTGIRSVLCVPLQDAERRVRGVLYADHCSRAVAFSSLDLMKVCSHARDLEHKLWQLERPRAPELVPLPPLQTPPPLPSARKTYQPEPASKPAPDRALRLSNRSLVVLLRSLPVLLSAGVPLTRALTVLGDEPSAVAVCRRMLTEVEQGKPLSVAMQKSSPSFTNLQLKLIKVGEATGSLVEVLARLADHEERARALALRLRSALTYPAVLFVLCMALIVAAPPFLLKGQLKMLDQIGGELPWLTKALFTLSDGRVLLALGAGAAFFSVLSWRYLQTEKGRYQLDRIMLEMPRVGRLWRLVAVAQFSQALALQLRVGLSILEAVPQAGAAANSPVLHERLQASVNALREGAGLDQSLAAADFFPTAFLSTVTAGEESGHVAGTLEWLAKLYQLELEATMEMAAAALEPLMMLAMGLMAGVVALATLLPLVKLVQTL